MSKPRLALITGPTSGIGAAFANLLAAEGVNLILVARNNLRLKQVSDELSSKHNIRCETIQADLSTPEGIKRVIARLSRQDVDTLINNAGFGLNRDFHKATLEDQLALTTTLVVAPMQLTHAALHGMKQLGCGWIINVSSVAAYMTGGTYCAAKAWLNTFSESLSEEVEDLNIKVHSVCPGFTRTEFHMRCNQDVSGVPNFMWLDANKVASLAWRHVLRGKPLTVPSMQYKLLVALHRYAPRTLVRVYAQLAKTFLRRGGRNT